MDILDDLKIMADSFDDEGDREMSAVFVRCIAEIRKLRTALEPLAGIDLCGRGLPEDFGLHVLRARSALKTPNDQAKGPGGFLPGPA
jgi:hypothetical protein